MSVARILLVEDEALIRLIMAEALEDQGFEVVQAASGDDARSLIDQAHRFDLMMTDIQMPGSLDGIALARHLHAVHPNVPVIYVTGRPEAMNTVGQLGPAEAFVRKPYGPSEIIRTAARLLNR